MAEYTPGASACVICDVALDKVIREESGGQHGATGPQYYQAVSSRRLALAFWGLWFIFGPMLLGAVIFFLQAVFEGGSFSDVLPAFLLGVPSCLILYFVTKAYLSRRRMKPEQCLSCGYNITHLEAPRCPECGAGFDPEDLPGESESRPSAKDTVGEARPESSFSHIPETDFPIECCECGTPLAGLGDAGHCPACAFPFDRRELLLDKYGPEVFIQEAMGQDERKSGQLNLARVAVTIGVFLAIAPMVLWAYQAGHGPREMWVLLFIFLFLAAGVELSRQGRGGEGEE